MEAPQEQSIPADLIESVAELWGHNARPGEMVEAEIRRFTEHREQQRKREEGERREEAEYQAASRKNAARKRQENARAWHEYHRAAAQSLRSTAEQMIRRHEERAAFFEKHLAG